MKREANNADRAARIEAVLETYAEKSGCPRADFAGGGEHNELASLLADCRHYARRRGISYVEANKLGKEHYEAELIGL
jgi:hypothetical protein